MSGVGGTNSGTYSRADLVQSSGARTNWTHIATNHIDGTGHFIFTNAAQTNAAQQFYWLQLP